MLPISRVINAVPPGGIGTFLLVTLGHAALMAVTIFLLMDGIKELPNQEMLLICLGVLFLWISIVPDLYEDYAPGPMQDTRPPYVILLLRFLLLILWITLLVLRTHSHSVDQIPYSPLPGTYLQMALTLPYGIGLLLGLSGVYALFRSLFKTLFATFGLLSALVHPIPRSPTTLP